MGRNGTAGGRLRDKVAIVTGGATGIGEAIVHKFAKDGAMVLVAGLPGDPVHDVVASVGKHVGTAIAFEGDLADDAQARACVELAVREFGRLDVLVNDAGVFLFTGEVQDYPADAFDATVRNNVRSVFLMTKRAVPHLQKSRGDVISAFDEACYVTGALWSVDGGITIGKGPVGEEAGKAAKRPPDQELRLEHQMDGLRNKDYHSAL